MEVSSTFPSRYGLLRAIAGLVCAIMICGATACADTGVPTNNNTANAPTSDVCDRVHIFYYDWYGAPPQQSGYIHWPQNGHRPPEDIASNYYPLLGPYSSSDPRVLRQHMAWIRSAHIGVITVTWWGQGSYEDQRTPAVLDAAGIAGLKVNFHLEPYPGQTPKTVMADVAYILEHYGKNPAFYRPAFLHERPMFYLFETLRHPAAEWRSATDELHRGAEPVLLIAQTTDLKFITAGGFDGGYTYDVLTPFKNARFVAQWNDHVAADFAAAGKLFIPSVGPGYWDDRAVANGGAVEPEMARTRDHDAATTYDLEWNAAIRAKCPFVTITSFNEWHEGTQIEPATSQSTSGDTYRAYSGGPMMYLESTAANVRKYAASIAEQHPTAPPK
ncbi:MAG TPA: glycoside hydrolase family 99 protein [Phycisphaerae bacterium]|nr:glycoside hydrolase family 99 protein [Phycisphaerae bacterium]